MVACLATGTAASALTGSEALGLTNSGQVADIALNYTTLKKGDRDSAETVANVVILQNRLVELGYLLGNVDGQYGQQTEDAVTRFQMANGLTPTGVADPTTQAVMHSLGAIAAEITEPEKTETLLVQQKLAQWGFLNGTVDGVAGKSTQTAVAMFKRYIYELHKAGYRQNATPEPSPEPTLEPGIQPVAEDFNLAENAILVEYGYDGEITEDVLKYVNGEYAFTTYEMKLQKGDRGDDVLRVQNRLSQLKYLYTADGSFGDLTYYALMYFQKRNGLPGTGVADRATQELLFSEEALMSDTYVFPYKLYVDISDQYVYVFGWDGEGYNKQVTKFVCSTGVDSAPTPIGTYQAAGKTSNDEWYYFEEYDCYAKYAYRIAGGILFHSVLYNSEKKGPTKSSVKALGKQASHGCVRLSVTDAQWIYENCPKGTTVVVQE